MGLLERGGDVRAKMVPNRRTRRSSRAEIRGNVAPGSILYTDAFASYRHGLDADYIHEVIDHSEEYVRGRVHTNGIENFWSLFKRVIYGTHHSVEPFHLDRYLDETVLRFNTRKMTDAGRFTHDRCSDDWPSHHLQGTDREARLERSHGVSAAASKPPPSPPDEQQFKSFRDTAPPRSERGDRRAGTSAS